MRTYLIPFSCVFAFAALFLTGCPSDSAPPDDPRASVNPGDIDRTGSCEGICGEQASTGCWCDEQCTSYDDCCLDQAAECTIVDPDPNSCESRCGEQAPGGCSCDTSCMAAGNCCADVETFCPVGTDPNSCEGHCDAQAPGGCWCDAECSNFGNCCTDYTAECDPGNPGTDPWAGLSNGPLIDALELETSGDHIGLDYTTARDHMYGVGNGIGLDIVGGLIEGIYTGVTAAPDGTRTPGGILNTEHSWPQSEGADTFPRRGDIHHLFPTYDVANSRRSNYEFNETVCTGNGCTWNQGGSELGLDSSGQIVFQVRQKYRGDIARSHFYFSVRYGLSIGFAEETALKAWHAQDPPDQLERDRNDAIESVQGNRNPFVDYPGLVDRISDF